MTISHSETNEQRDNCALHGRVAVVTGGSSGIGASCARLLAAHGASIVIGYHKGKDRAENLSNALPGTGHCAVPILLSGPTAEKSLDDLVEQLKRQHGRVDYLINSAGFTERIPHTDVERLNPALFSEILLGNAAGTYAITRALLPLLRDSGDAVVVNVSSVSAFTGSGSNIAYCAAKAAVDTMTQSFARSFGHGIRFLCVSPAAVDTDFVAGRARAEVQEKASKTPLGRVVTADDVADTVLACITHLRTATGTRVIIDGGHLL
ncbi:SDR family NAD(P)-dependent oxidoreductase [Paraburkholderia youngii]|uniref:SDR family NAD(P)-dependent oxidoreductase n=1 Tax=Paraburkholderia youngii TaxID=2782701 RepID=UPI003D261C63